MTITEKNEALQALGDAHVWAFKYPLEETKKQIHQCKKLSTPLRQALMLLELAEEKIREHNSKVKRKISRLEKMSSQK
ncbi:hypothetical protein [Algivirga pacifica]|uniref:Uncharacterized protein n=1 Tax=Algivirga pacifica TaxID=1162670 RepID=A0ABP9DCF2_9BACT